MDIHRIASRAAARVFALAVVLSLWPACRLHAADDPAAKAHTIILGGTGPMWPDRKDESPGPEVMPELAECTPATRRKEIIADEKPRIWPRAAKLDAVSGTGSFRRAEKSTGRSSSAVTHYLVTRALGVEPEARLEMSVAHASLTQIRGRPTAASR